MSKIKLLLAIKMEVPREGIKKILESEPSFELVFVCSTGTQAVENAVEYEPNVIVIDDELLESAGFNVIDCIHQRLPNTPMVLLAWSEATMDFYGAFKSGIRGYLIKGLMSENLINTIKSVSGGEVVIPSSVAAGIVEQLSLLEKHRDMVQSGSKVRLGKREKELLSLVAQGLTNSEIATILFVSEHTVKQHMRNIMGKLHAHTRQQAVALAAERQLLS